MNSPELPQENKEKPETDFNREFKNAIETLKDVFSVENLSTIELSHLRRITKDVIERADASNQPGSDLGRIQTDKEIATRFLQELYGIDYFTCIGTRIPTKMCKALMNISDGYANAPI